MDHSAALEPILKSKAVSHFAHVGHGPVWLDVGTNVCGSPRSFDLPE